MCIPKTDGHLMYLFDEKRLFELKRLLKMVQLREVQILKIE
jgi:hypothetical protein